VSATVERRPGGTPLNRSIEQATRMLGLFSPQRPELTLAEMTARMGSTRATVHRHAMALRHAGLLRHDPTRQLYSLGPRIVELAASALAGLRIIKIAGPYMERLLTEVNETIVLSVWDGEAPVVVRVDDNTDRVARIVVRTGAKLPARSAQGKVFAAFGEGSVAAAGIGAEELALVRSSAIAVNSQVVEGIRAIATPVFQDTELSAAMAIVGTTAGIPDDPGSPMAIALREAAQLLSAELGFLPGTARAAPGAAAEPVSSPAASTGRSRRP
jgi:IclR family pca regulon transcriptional regulator